MVVQTLDIEGKRYVLIRESDYRRLRISAEKRVAEPPALPKPDKKGRYPAIEYARASLARRVIRDRKASGLSQQALAGMAGIRQETLSRIESGKHTPTVRTLEKIQNALQRSAQRHPR